MIKELIAGRFEQCPVHKISENDSNKFVLLCDGNQAPFVSVIEIFDVSGKTPPNVHSQAYEYFYVLSGEGTAVVGEKETALKNGSFLVVPPGHTHEVINTGQGRLYVLTTMVPDERFSDLIQSGPKAYLDQVDLAVLRGL